MKLVTAPYELVWSQLCHSYRSNELHGRFETVSQDDERSRSNSRIRHMGNACVSDRL